MTFHVKQTLREAIQPDGLEKEKMGGSYQVSTREHFPLPSNANNFCVESDLDCRYSGPYILFLQEEICPSTDRILALSNSGIVN